MWSSIVLSFKSQALRRPVHHWRPLMRRPLELASARCSKPSLPNQARLDRRDPRLGLTQRLGTCLHAAGAQDKLVIMRDSPAKHELPLAFPPQLHPSIPTPNRPPFPPLPPL